MKIFIGKNHACDINYTYSFLTDELYNLGEVVEDVSEADVIVFPATCCATLDTFKGVMNYILNLLKNKKEGAITFITGCMTNNIKDSELSNMANKFLNDNFDYIVPQENIADIVNILSQKNKMENGFGACLIYRNAAELFISKGCVNKCSFCKVNYLNLPVKSIEFESLKNCIISLPDEVSAVNLLGMNLAQYGLDLNSKYNLIDVIKLLDNKESINDISIYAVAFKDAIQNQYAKYLKTKKIKTICGSIETGSPRLLSMMNKGYTIPDLLTFWNEINEVNQKRLVTDIIAGFPTETYDDIELTLELLNKLKPAPEDITIHKYQNSPYIPSSKYSQLTEDKINEHYDIYVRELKSRN